MAEYLRDNYSTTFKLDEEELFNLITDILVECEFKCTVEAYDSMLLWKYFKLAKLIYQEFNAMYQRKKKDDEYLNLDLNGKICQEMLVVHFLLKKHKS